MNRQDFEKLNVLVIDDNEHTVQLLTRMLHGFGIQQITSAKDGSTAFPLLKVKKFDIIICDWAMKPINGIQFARRVRRDPQSPCPFVPIIMLTGHSDVDRVIEARDAGVNDFLAKPIAPATLLQRMIAALEKPREFIKADEYFGPDRRRRDDTPVAVERREQPPVEVPAAEDAKPDAAPAPASEPVPKAG